MDWQRIEPWDFVITHVASEYKRKFNMVEIEDIKLALYEWFNEHPNKLDEWEKIGEKDAKNLLYRSLRNQALDFCQEFKAKNLGYETSDLYYYEPEIVEALLPAVLRGEWGVTHKLNLGRPGRPSAPAEGGNLSAMMIEIESAYRRLSTEDKRILFLRYAESMDYKEISNFLSLNSDDAARMRGNRAVKRLVFKLGGFRPYLDKDTPDNKSEGEDNIVEGDKPSNYSEGNETSSEEL
jgi:DNA-directed RNA polymerase specialized sigma24 family protein